LHLKVGIVPESDGNSFILRQPVADIHIRRNDRSPRIGGARRQSGAPNDVVWRGEWSVGCASCGSNKQQCRRQQAWREQATQGATMARRR
jgi:hypothetical protein